MSQFAFYSYGLAGIAFLVLLIMLLVGWGGRFKGAQLMAAIAGSALWAFTAAAQVGFGQPGIEMVWATEVVRNLLWIFFLVHLLRPFANGFPLYTRLLNYVRLGSLSLGLLMLVLLVDVPGVTDLLQVNDAGRQFSLIGQLLFSVLGLALVEQLFRNTRVDQRWCIKHLCFGLGVVFVFDFYLYTDAVLFYRLDGSIWSARGFVNLMAIPLIGVTAARNPDWSLPIFVSRRMVLHSTTLFSAGLYMLVMASVGYYIKIYGGEWGNVLQITFLFGAVVVLVALLFSGQFRARAKVFFNKHFFHYRYDYREEWLRVTGLLAANRSDLPLNERVIWALAEIVESPGGLLWVRNEKGDFRFRARFSSYHAVEELVPGSESMIEIMQQRRWVIDIEEAQHDPDLYNDRLQLPAWLSGNEDAWLVVPLIHNDLLIGFVVLMQPRAPQSINWENIDLLKTVGVQAASYIALNQAAEALAEARQFEGFNRLSAFVMHDLKNLIAQLSLVAKNAAKHKHNPDFIDDAVRTIENSVTKMNRLMAQLKSAHMTGDNHPVNLVEELRDVVHVKSNGKPVPKLTTSANVITIMAEPERLSAVLGHVVQNAQDATPDDGEIEIRLRVAGGQAVIEVKDSGVGMDADFIKERLFRPFDSTKGLTGMGIGAYECREVISALGGQVVVESTPGAGTLFRIMLPTVPEPAAFADRAVAE